VDKPNQSAARIRMTCCITCRTATCYDQRHSFCPDAILATDSQREVHRTKSAAPKTQSPSLVQATQTPGIANF
jgi:hypothetical protein